MTAKNFTSRLIVDCQCPAGKKQHFISDAKTPGLGLRVTSTGKKSYIFETRLHGKTVRLTIGDVRAWSISDAQKEAARLKVMTDQGIDPREVRRNQKTAQAEKERKKKLDCITLGEAWQEYISVRKPHWSESHYHDHKKVIRPGGEVKSRSKDLTTPGSLATMVNDRLIDITSTRLIDWACIETVTRPTQARLTMRLLRAFLNWCMSHDTYQHVITINATQNKELREILGKPKVKHDVLQREQLPAWFDAVQQLSNPVISAYLQTLLLTGARREEMAGLRWEDVDFQWSSMIIRDKVEGQRIIPLTPYVAYLLANLPRRNQWVFSSPTAASSRLADPRPAHNKALTIAGLPHLTLHGLRRTFASLSEWVEMPGGIAAQIQGHKPQGVREQNYIRRPLDLLRKWHINIETWILEQAGVNYTPQKKGLHVIKG